MGSFFMPPTRESPMAESDMDQELDDATDKDWRAETDKWKALARKHEEQAKANSAAAKRLADIEAANKSEAEKAAEARALLERERDDARLALLKREAADAAGLPVGWAKRLTGSTKEELEADAKELAKDMPKAPANAANSGRPVADLKPGALPAGDRSPQTSADIDAWIRAQARGR